jgi:hypothetical protein
MIAAVAGDITVEAFESPLAAVRRVLDDADEALLGVAFVQQRGVNLIEPQLARLRDARLVCATAFGSTTSTGLQGAQDRGLTVRVLNPRQGIFHPKLYRSRAGGRARAAIGSANLTGGLVSNVESVAVLSGDADAPVLRQLWELGESWWRHDAAVAWSPTAAPAAPEVLDAELLLAIRAAVAAQPVVPTISDGRPNWIRELTPDGVWVETERSRQLGRPPQHVPAWMIQIAWEYLAFHGTLTNRYLLADDGLNVKRSSFVCALLAALPGVTVTSRRPIELRIAH